MARRPNRSGIDRLRNFGRRIWNGFEGFSMIFEAIGFIFEIGCLFVRGVTSFLWVI